jgi:hypothetical protein
MTTPNEAAEPAAIEVLVYRNRFGFWCVRVRAAGCEETRSRGEDTAAGAAEVALSRLTAGWER